ncbi:MAG TPA: hypothetical protein VLB02_02380 [Candidatus Paceibacterota bacterium]|nr:hypothetical protein [Candidatus Paceibacterota bacterium]
MKKWYFASRMRHQEKIKEVCDFLTAQGEQVVCRWVYEQSLAPYKQNQEKIATLAVDSIQGVIEADVFVLISDPEGTDMFVELGAALAAAVPAEKKIYNVGSYSKRSLLQTHPSIIHAASLPEVFKAEQINYSKYIIPSFE